MEKVEKRRRRILEILRDNPEKTQQQVCDEIGCSLRTIKSDYVELKKQGYKLNTLRDRSSLDDVSDFKMVSANDNAIRAILLLCGLTAGENSIDEISEGKFDEYIASRSTVFRSIKPYLADNHLIEKRHGYITPSSIYMTSLPEDYSDILKFAAHCLSQKEHGGQEVYEQALRYLYGRNLVFRSKQDYMLTKIPFYMQTLENNLADMKPVSFIYKGKPINFFFLGFVAYSIDKDIIYLIGRTKTTRTDYKVFKADELDWDTIRITENSLFEKTIKDHGKNDINKMKCFFRKLQAEMFDVVEDSLQPVKVRIRYSAESDDDLRQLYLSRKRQWESFDMDMAFIRVSEEEKKHNVPRIKYLDRDKNELKGESIHKSVEYIEYSDEIRGISHFSNYLRRFGDAVEVIGNDKLKAAMVSGAVRALEHYKE
ncbi:MAG: WYL domain-containing protein [Lachnospiraceae bacterium]|nr:WYL domain-containing protein [Lachnospiraceae bacterium]